MENLIRVELRYMGDEELKTINEEISLSGATIIGQYDGMIEVDIPASSLEILKKKHILMDFPYQQKLSTDNDASLLGVSNPQAETGARESEWMSVFKTKARKAYSDWFDPSLEVRSDPEEKIEEDAAVQVAVMQDDKKDLEDLYIVTFNGPLNSVWRSAFRKHGLKFCTYFDSGNEYCYKVSLTEKQYQYLRAQEITKTIGKYEIERKITDSLVKELDQASAGLKGMPSLKQFDIVVSEEKQIDKVSELIKATGEATIVDSGLNIIRIEINPGSSLISALANSPYVSGMAVYEPPTLFCDVSRKVIGLEYPDTHTSAFYGAEETVAVIDSGIDQHHPDLQHRIKTSLQYGMGSVEDQHGHGTHVAGIICGDGTASGGKITGIAPKTAVVTIGIVNSSGQLDLPVDIGKLLKIAADQGAKIINLSLGWKVNGEYQFGSFSVDKFIYENPEILLVVAAGNEGNAVNGRLAYKTVGAPATAKNALTVGSCSGRRTHPVINQTWGDLRPASFPVPPLNTMKLISDIDHPSLGSSTGPTDFDSIKPEVLAPGAYILSAKAGNVLIAATNSEFYDEHYTFKTGTSMATPVVSGMAALIREYLRKVHHYNNPSSSLIKAIIIGNSRKIDSYRHAPEDPSLEKIGFPDFDQGFGLVDMNRLLNEQNIQLQFVDILNTAATALVSRAELGGPLKSVREYVIDLAEGSADLSVTLCWIDPPAKGIQNNLQLSVKLPDNEWRLGNMEHNYKKDPLFDTLFDLKPLDKNNNTEKVWIKDPLPGKYLIRITAQNTLSKQGYSLAVLGNGTGFTER